jgi:molybdopterin-containing oxidoreductase family iron-sulfur binding subunit
MRELFNLENADVIVSLDRDFLQLEPTSLVSARGFAAKRRPLKTDDAMNRLYVVESSMTITGGKADHRVAMAPSLIPAFAVALAKELGIPGVGSIEVPQGVRLDTNWLKEVAKDLNANKGRSVVMAGPTQPAAVHALVHAINEALENVGKTVNYLPMGEDEASSSVQGVRLLVDGLNGGSIKTVVCLNVNPVYDAPSELNFGTAFARAKTRITLRRTGS